MSSYSQQTTTTTVGEAVKCAKQEIAALWDEMSDLCAEIAAQFPDTYKEIAKYQEAVAAHDALCEAFDLIEEVDLDYEHRDAPMSITVGKQTRRNRPTSQRVRLANAVVQLTKATDALRLFDDAEIAEVILHDIIKAVDGVSFPKTWG